MRLDSTVSGSSKRPLRAAVAACIASLTVGLTALPAAAQFTPNETLVSPNPGLIDAEFSQSRAKIAWTDSKGNLWLGGVNRDTGAFEPASGKGQLIATGTVDRLNMFMWNGPEWISTASGEQIFYSYYLPGKLPIAVNTRMAIASEGPSGAWTSQTLSPESARMSHIASKNPGDTNPHIKYLDPQQRQYWRNVNDPGSEQLLSFIPQSTKSWRFASGMRALMYAAPVAGTQQVFRYLLDTRISEQLTFDSGAKDTDRTVPWVWQAPEFGGDFVLSTVVDGSELRVYRQFAGTSQWTPIYSAFLPAGSTAGSPEWFTYNGKSYVYMVVYVSPYTFPTEIWISNIDAANPLFRRITSDSFFRARNDPEVFVTTRGPLIYYNRYDPSIDPAHPLCGDCSEGVYRADPGLAGR